MPRILNTTPDGENDMNIYIHNLLIDIERRTQEILDDIRSLKEQVFYAYDPDADSGITQEAFEADRQEAFEHMVNENN